MAVLPWAQNTGDTVRATATILNGASTVTIDTGGITLTGVTLPATWTSAKISFLASPDGITYGPVYTSAGEYASAAAFAGGEHFALDPGAFYGLRFLQIRSGTNGAAVTQSGADRVLTLIGRSL